MVYWEFSCSKVVRALLWGVPISLGSSVTFGKQGAGGEMCLCLPSSQRAACTCPLVPSLLGGFRSSRPWAAWKESLHFRKGTTQLHVLKPESVCGCLHMNISRVWFCQCFIWCFGGPSLMCLQCCCFHCRALQNSLLHWSPQRVFLQIFWEPCLVC